MKMKLVLALILGCLIFTCGCSGSGASAKVKEFVNLAGKRNIEGMLKLMPQGEGGGSTAHDRNRDAVMNDMDLISIASQGVTSIDILKETANDKTATIEASVLGVAYPKAVTYTFQLQSEKGEWRILQWKRVEDSH